MAETKNWTPGPWAIDGWHTSAVIAKLPDESYVRVADCDTPSFPNLDWKANAHPIAAAPALYEALSECLQLRYPFTGKYDEKQSLDHWLSEDKEGNGEAKFWIAAHAALALAEGKQ